MKLAIDRLGHLGDGIGTGPDGPVYAAQTLPGEVVEGDLQGDRLHGIRIITPSPERVTPPCPHARSCGGCAMQHASDGLVAGWKEGIVRGALAGQGLDALLRPILTSPPASRRRAVLAGRRTRGGALIGFHQRGADTITPIPDCRLLHPDLMAVFPALAALVVLGGSRKADVALTVTRSDAGPDIAVEGGKAPDASLRQALARIAEDHRIARLTWSGEVVALRAVPVKAFGKARVALPPGAFLQATDHGEASLIATVMQALGQARKVADLFAGCGTFSLPLADGAEVLAVEGDAAMTAALDRAARQTPGLKRVTVETRDLFRRPLQPEEMNGFDAAVIDPPRAGAEAQAEALARSRVPIIAYVSCNPATFARDARILQDRGYRIDWVQPVDQFRWSVHVELAARLSVSR